MYNNKYNFGSLKNILGKSERRDYGREAWWLNWREFRFQGRLEVSRRAAGLRAWAAAMGMTGAMEGGLTACSARQECATWRTPRASTQTNPGPVAGRGENQEQRITATPWGTGGCRSKMNLKRTPTVHLITCIQMNFTGYRGLLEVTEIFCLDCDFMSMYTCQNSFNIL